MERKPSAIRAAQRGIWFFVRTAILLVALFFLAYGVFLSALRASNLYILATEGLQLRAQCVLSGEISTELREYFTEQFIQEDKQLHSGAYDNYTVTGFDYRVSVEKMSVLPWSQTASVTLTERMVSISGSIHEDKKPANAPEDAVYPLPTWRNARYVMRFRLQNGRFYAYQLQLIEQAPSETPKRTPDMSMTPMPARTVEE